MLTYLYDIVFVIQLTDNFLPYYTTHFAKTLNTSTHQKLQKIKDKILKLKNLKKYQLYVIMILDKLTQPNW